MPESSSSPPPPESEDETPAPNYYSPKHNLTYPSAPKYSITGRTHVFGPNVLPFPSPADNDIRENLLQPDHKAIALTAKNITWPFAPRKNAHIIESPGPNIKRTDKSFGSNLVRASLSSRSKDGIIRAHPGNFANPVDTYGFYAPGPANYTPHPINKQNGVSKSFGLNYHTIEQCKDFPGPDKYLAHSQFDDSNKGPIIGEIILDHTFEKSPAPNEYDLPSTNNPNISPSIKSRKLIRDQIITTAPNLYVTENIGSIGTSKIASSLQYKQFPWTCSQRPSPNTYYTEFIPFEVDKSPLHGVKCLPTYPDILNYPEYATFITPAPVLPCLSQIKPHAPLYSFANPHRTQKPFTPGPNNYRNENVVTSRHVKPPSYSIRPKTMQSIEYSNSNICSGPADYAPRHQGCSAPAYSFRIKHDHLESKETAQTDDLSPNSYTVGKNQTHKGVSNGPSYSFQSKFSPKVYSGFTKSVLNKLSNLSK